METDSLMMSLAEDGNVHLEKAHGLHRKFLVIQLIDAEKLIPALNRDKISYLISDTYPLNHRPVDTMPLN